MGGSRWTVHKIIKEIIQRIESYKQISAQSLPHWGPTWEFLLCLKSVILQMVTTQTITQHNINTVVGLDMKMTVQTPPHITIHWSQLNMM